jgi:hypothetical protein
MKPPNVMMVNGIMVNVIMVNVIMVNVIMANVIMINVIIVNVIVQFIGRKSHIIVCLFCLLSVIIWLSVSLSHKILELL